MQTNPRRQPLNQHLLVAMPADLKQKAHEIAAKQGVTVAHLVRTGLAAVIEQSAA
ncbi:hypothetical protein [Devosia naphthalenivorans]|uniref:hypothetical protein n=1 Tax=Devosia naphthalenivorans TaxID=2082392 RepID=UPI0013B06C33|nr:hypothetical protein [Devosia naphthalenivorans]